MRASGGLAEGIGAAYGILQVLNISFGLAIIPCSVLRLWLKGLMGRAGGLGAYLQGEEPTEVTLAAVVSSIGLSVATDIKSLKDFLDAYRSGQGGRKTLATNIESTVREFRGTLERINQESSILDAQLRSADCDQEGLEVLR